MKSNLTLYNDYFEALKRAEDISEMIYRDGIWLTNPAFVWTEIKGLCDMYISGQNPSGEKEIWRSEKQKFFKTNDVDLPLDNEITGKFCLFVGLHMGHYGHAAHDHLPIYETLRRDLDDDVKFLIPKTGTTYEVLTSMDSSWKEKIVEFDLCKPVSIKGMVYFFPYRNMGSINGHIKFHREAMRQTLCKQECEITKEHIVFCPRSLDNHHGRGNTAESEAEITNLIKIIIKNQKKEIKFSVFRHKEHPTPNLQKDLFKDATIIIGVHGTAMTNMIWSSRFCSHTQKPLQIIEAVGLADLYDKNRRIKHQQRGNDLGYYKQFGEGFNVEWRHLNYYPINNTFKHVDVNLNHLRRALIDSLHGI
jgi:hypothetical protein